MVTRAPASGRRIRSVTFLLPGRPRRPVGGYKVVHGYANGLARRGNLVTLVYSPGLLLPEGQAPTPLVRSKFAAARLLRPARRIGTDWVRLDPSVRVIESLRPPDLPTAPGDLIVATAVQTMPHAARLSATTGAHGVALIQGYEEWSASPDFVEAAWRLPLFRIVVSPWLVAKGRELGVETHLLRNAVSSEAFPLGPPIADRPLSVGTMLSTQASKRLDVAIAVFEQLRAQLPEVEGMAFGVGRRPRDLPRYVRYVQTPAPDGLARLYQTVRVFFSSSDSEGWGLPASEATMAGATVVSTENGGVRSAIGDGARYAQCGDVAGLAALILELLQDDETAQTNATRARERIRAYTLDDATTRLSELLDQARA